MFALFAIWSTNSAFGAASSSSAAATPVCQPEPVINVACRNGQLGIVRRLLAYNARPTIKAQQIAFANGHSEIVQLLQDHKFTCRTCNKKYEKVLSKCAKCKIAPYCSADCQRKDWPTHKTYCKSSATTEKALGLSDNDQKLVDAARTGNISKLKKLINEDNVNFCHPALGPILTLAIASQKIKAVKFLLNQHSINIDQLHPIDKSTALFNACQLGYTGIVKLLLSKGANPNIQILDGATPLFIAAQEGHTEIVQIFLEHTLCKKYLNKPMHDGSTPIYAAARHNKPRIVEQLLHAKAETTATTAMGQTALFVAVGLGYSNIINKILQHDVSSIDQPNFEGATPLMFACQIGHREAVECLLSKGANIEITKPNNANALHVACINNHPEIIQLLLDNGADPCTMDEDGKTPLMYACIHGSVESTQLLLEDRRVDPNDRIQSGRLGINFWVTPLIAACAKERTEVVELLLSYKSVDPNKSIVSTGKGPLIIAIELGNVEIVQLLLQKGADPTQADTIMRTPLAFAQAHKEKAAAEKKPVFDNIIKLLNQGITTYAEKHTCIGCNETFDYKLRRCAGCQKVRYCSLECHEKDWYQKHGRICKHPCTGCNNRFERKLLKRCSGCKKARYCSRECQTSDWPNHTKACKKPKSEPTALEHEIDDTLRPEEETDVPRPENECDLPPHSESESGIVYRDYIE